MTPDELWREKLAVVIADFMARTDGDQVFKARLYGLGFRSNLLECEYRYHLTNRDYAKVLDGTPRRL